MGVLEVVRVLAPKSSDARTRLGPTAIGVAAAVISFVLLTFTWRILPAHAACAVRVGTGAVGVATVRIVTRGERIIGPRVFRPGPIVRGVVERPMVES